MQLCGQSPLFHGEWQKGKPELPAHVLNIKSPKAKPDITIMHNDFSTFPWFP